ncbi:HmuY family protein [uncultured Chitinophaga sp.]|uniref:HmuY family protein n=1 Tax=uncultured Chitinophaga sp. TaxID=339340 RepID=UPI0025ECF84D|nr:HmuY family protein [uncultured Chitinophaga sp.]
MRINYKHLLVVASAAVMTFVACDKDDDKPVIRTATSVTDLAADTAAATGQGAKAPRYFTFATQTLSATGTDSSKWDISFTSTYNGNVTASNGKIALVDTAFDALTTAPADTAFKYATVGIDGFGQTGWYVYNMTTHIVSPKANRTIVLRTAAGKYAKLQMISLYKGNPAAPTLQTPVPYLTFKYFVQANGSRNLTTIQ